MTDQDESGPESRRQAVSHLIRLFPHSCQTSLAELYREAYSHRNNDDHAPSQFPSHAEKQLFSALALALNQATTEGSLSRRGFLQAASILTSAGLWALLFPRSAEAYGFNLGAFWTKKSGAASTNYPANTGSDPYWDYVVLLMNMDSASGIPSTVFADESNVGKSLTLNGSPYIDTSAGSSPYSSRTGSARFSGSSEYLLMSNHADWSFSNETAFTIEAWIYVTTGSKINPIVANDNNSGTVPWALAVSASNKLDFFNDGNTSTTSTTSIATNTWTHVVAVLTSAQTRLYINGILDATKTYSSSMSAQACLMIARCNNYGASFSGSIADLRIYKGIAKYTSNFTPRTSPIGLGTANDKYWGYCVLACPFENSLKDVSGYQCVKSGSISLSTSQKKYGTASAQFNGTSQCLAVTSQNFTFPADFTAEAWVYLTSQPSSGAYWPIASNWNDGSANARCWFFSYGNNSGTLIFNCQVSYSGTGGDVSLQPSYTLSLNTWHHVALTRMGSMLMLFVDGTLVGSVTASGALYSGGTQIFGIGCNYTNGSPSGNYFNGSIDSLRITKGAARYTSTFTPPTASFPVGKDETVDPFWTHTVLAMHMDDFSDSTGRHTITNNGSITNSTSSYKYGTASSSITAVTQYLSTPTSGDLDFAANDFTVEFWLYTSAAQTAAYANLIGKMDNTSYGWQLYLSSSGGSIKCSASTGSSSWDIFWSTTFISTVPNNAWNHIALTRSGSSWRAFLNGVLQSTNTSSASIFSNSGPLYIGGEAWSHGLIGNIDDLRITKGVARYIQNFTPPTRAFAFATSSLNWANYDGSQNGAITNGPVTSDSLGRLSNVITELSSTAFAVFYTNGSNNYAQVYNVSGTAITAVGSATTLTLSASIIYGCGVVTLDKTNPAAVQVGLLVGSIYGLTINSTTGAVTQNGSTTPGSATPGYCYGLFPGTKIALFNNGNNEMVAIDFSTISAPSIGSLVTVASGSSYQYYEACILDANTVLVASHSPSSSVQAVTRSGTTLTVQSTTKSTPMTLSSSGYTIVGVDSTHAVLLSGGNAQQVVYNGTSSAITYGSTVTGLSGTPLSPQNAGYNKNSFLANSNNIVSLTYASSSTPKFAAIYQTAGVVSGSSSEVAFDSNAVASYGMCKLDSNHFVVFFGNSTYGTQSKLMVVYWPGL